MVTDRLERKLKLRQRGITWSCLKTLLLTVAIIKGDLVSAEFQCREEGYHEDPSSCSVYYRCVNWGDSSPLTKFRFECGPGTVFSAQTGNICVHPYESERSQCSESLNDLDSDRYDPQAIQQTGPPAAYPDYPSHGSPLPGTSSTGVSPSTSSGFESTTRNYGTTGNTRPPSSNYPGSQPANQDHNGSECQSEGFMPDNKDCRKFIRCVSNGGTSYQRFEFTCGEGTIWDQSIEACNHEWAVPRNNCGGSSGGGSSPAHGNQGNSPTPSYGPGSSGGFDQHESNEVPRPPGYPSQSPQGPNQGYPGLQGSNQGYPRPQGSTQGYPGAQDPNQGYPGSQSSNQGYPRPQGTTEGYPGSQGSNQGYPGSEGSNQGYPGSQGSSQGYPGSQGPNQGYPQSPPASQGGGRPSGSGYPPSSQPGQAPSRPATSPSPSYPPPYPGAPETQPDRPSSSLPSASEEPVGLYPPPPEQSGQGAKPRPDASGSCTSEGFFPHPTDCKKFIRCVEGNGAYTKFEFQCGEGTAWDQSILTCNHLYAVPGCGPSGGSERPASTDMESTRPSSSNEVTPEPDSNQPSSVTTAMSPTSPVTVPSESTDVTTSGGQPESTPSTQSPDEGSAMTPMEPEASSEKSPSENSSPESTTSSESTPSSASTTSSESSSSTSSATDTMSTESNETDESSSSTVGSSPASPSGGSGAGSGSCMAEGFFPDPKDCHKFIRCVSFGAPNSYTKFSFACGPGTAWDQNLQTCNYEYQVESCETSPGPSTPSFGRPDESINEVESTSSASSSEKTTTSLSSESTESSSGESTTSESSSTTETESSESTSEESVTSESSSTTETESSESTSEESMTSESSSTTEAESTESTSANSSEETSSPESTEEPQASTAPSGSTSAKPSGGKPSPKFKCTEEGFFPNPADCHKFIRCVKVNNGFIKYNFDCGPGTAWDQNLLTCNYEDQVESCEAGEDTGPGLPPTSSPSEGTSPSEKPEGTSTTGSTDGMTETTAGGEGTESTEGTTAQESTTAGGEGMETTAGGGEEMETTSAGGEETTTASGEEAETTEPAGGESTTEEPATETTESSATTPPDSMAAPCQIGNLTDEQIVLVCPTGFRRHPKHCNMFYQCTSEGDMQIKILVLACPEGTIYDDSKVQCVPEAETDQKCMASGGARFYRSLEQKPIEAVRVTRDSLCPDEGHYPYQEGCSNVFYKCNKNSRNSLQGYLYKCPKDFVYWSVSRRCERTSRLPTCSQEKYKNNERLHYWENKWELPIEESNLSARSLKF